MNDLFWLAVVQVLTEVAPISSSGHVAVVHMLALRVFGVTLLLPKTLDYLLNGMSALVMVCALRHAWWQVLSRACIGNVSIASRQRVARMVWQVTLAVTCSTLVTVPLYFAANALIDYTGLVLWLLPCGFIITAWLLYTSRRWCAKTTTGQPLNLVCAGVLGLVQALAVVPGISRMGATYLVALGLGLRPDRAFQTSVLLALPIMGAAACKAVLLDGVTLPPMAYWQMLLFAGAVMCSYALFTTVRDRAYQCRLAPLAAYLLIVALVAVVLVAF